MACVGASAPALYNRERANPSVTDSIVTYCLSEMLRRAVQLFSDQTRRRHRATAAARRRADQAERVASLLTPLLQRGSQVSKLSLIRSLNDEPLGDASEEGYWLEAGPAALLTARAATPVHAKVRACLTSGGSLHA